MLKGKVRRNEKGLQKKEIEEKNKAGRDLDSWHMYFCCLNSFLAVSLAHLVKHSPLISLITLQALKTLVIFATGVCMVIKNEMQS